MATVRMVGGPLDGEENTISSGALGGNPIMCCPFPIPETEAEIGEFYASPASDNPDQQVAVYTYDDVRSAFVFMGYETKRDYLGRVRQLGTGWMDSEIMEARGEMIDT